MNIPSNLKYTTDDEWIRLEGETAYVGITDYAQHELGDITFVDVDPDLVGETRSGIFAPVRNLGLVIIDEEHENSYKSGSSPRYHARQVAMYRAKKENAKLVNTDPYGEAWIIKIKVNDPAEVDALMDAAAYEAKIG